MFEIFKCMFLFIKDKIKMKNRTAFVLSIVFLLSVSWCRAEDRIVPALFPWQMKEGEIRQLYRLESVGQRHDFTVDLPAEKGSVLAEESAGPLLFFDPENPDKPPVYQRFDPQGGNENLPRSVKQNSDEPFKSAPWYQVKMSGPIDKDHPRYLFVYRGGKTDRGRNGSAARDVFIGDDYATSCLGRSWSFEDGRFDQINNWGNRSGDYGKITVQDGWLVIPVLKKDVYFIFGVMWGKPDDPRRLKIDSSVYRYLEMEICQSVSKAQWKIFVTDESGNYKDLVFSVQGKEKQTIRLDLAECFPEYWGKHVFQAIRIDPIKNQPNSVAKIRYVRLLSGSVSYRCGPVFTKSQIEHRGRIQKLECDFVRQMTVGQKISVNFRTILKQGSVLPDGSNVRLVFKSAVRKTKLNNYEPVKEAGQNKIYLKEESNKEVVGVGKQIETDTDSGAVSKTEVNSASSCYCQHEIQDLTVGASGQGTGVFLSSVKAGTVQESLGLCDDLGESFNESIFRAKVRPDKIVRYYLRPESKWFNVSKDQIKIDVIGLDRFGNAVPVDLKNYELHLDPKLSAVSSAAGLAGCPASFSVKLKEKTVREKLAVQLIDKQGNTGRTEIIPVKYRSTGVFLNSNGFTVREDGSPYLAVGGLYGNWPHKPIGNGGLTLSMDLFPCGSKPYVFGWPWKAEVEKNVRLYFEHCKKHGINTIRLMLRNMDLVGKVDQTQLSAVVHYMKIGYEYGIRFNIVLLEDYLKPPYINSEILEKIVLPHYTASELEALPPHRARFLVRKEIVPSLARRYSDPDVRECQKDYLRELIPVLAEQEAVFCYEFENEMHEYPGDDWCREMTELIRSIDPKTLILGNPDTMTRARGIQWRNSFCDLLAYHTYNNGFADADTGTFIILKANWARLAGRPFLTGEGGVYDFKAADKQTRLSKEVQGIRDHIWGNFCAGGIAFMYWTLLNEPIANEIDKISVALKAVEIDLSAMPRKRPEVALIVPAELTSGDGELAVDPSSAALVLKLLERGCDFDCVLKGEEKEYAVCLDYKEEKIPETLKPTVAAPSVGWNLATLVSNDEKRALLYLRNNAGGVRNFSADPVRPRYFRDNKPDTAQLKLTDPGHWKKIIAYNLATGETENVVPRLDGTFILKKTDGDFIIGLHSGL